MKILIIEDEQPNFLRLRKMLTEMNPSCEIDGPLVSLGEVRAYFDDGGKPDLVISDIRLSDGIVFDAFDDVQCDSRIIFTTAYSEYAVKAFQYNSIHYLLKPIVREELEKAVEKALQQSPENLSDMRRLTASTTSGAARQRFLVPWRDGFEIVRVEEVSHIVHSNGVLRLYMHSGMSFQIDMTIDDCEAQLSDDMFFRANRQYIININSIQKLISYWDRKIRVVLTDYPEVEIIVSRDKSKALRQWLDR